MARAQLNTQLAEFEAVVKAMREHGVASWAGSPVGDIMLGAEPVRPQKAAKVDPTQARRDMYTELLGRPVSEEEAKRLP